MPLSLHNQTRQIAGPWSVEHIGIGSRFSWRNEIRHLFSRPVFSILWWPVFKFRQRRLEQSVLIRQCKNMPAFRKLWSCVQKSSFAYNVLFLRHSPLKKTTSRTSIVDLATLALCFGDEFLDGLASLTGKHYVQELIKNNPAHFHLKKRTGNNQLCLAYDFEIDQLLDASFLDQVNKQYGISYRAFYQLLKSLLAMLNDELNTLPAALADRVADNIVQNVNSCFDSFVYDIHSCCDADQVATPEEVWRVHDMKTGAMQLRLLELRSILAEKEDWMQHIDMPGWLDIMRVLQIYDDIQDILPDHGIQDNLLISVAAHYFPAEYKWFITHKKDIPSAGEEKMLLSFYMPGSLHYCFQQAAERIRAMNWEQRKIIHYILRKNDYELFLLEKNKFPGNDKELVSQFYSQVSKTLNQNNDNAKSFVTDSLLHIRHYRKLLLKGQQRSLSYQLRYDQFSVSPRIKKEILNSILNDRMAAI